MNDRPAVETLFAFDPGAGELRNTPVLGAAAVVDSFLVDDGIIRGLDRHVQRFVLSCAAWRGVDARSVQKFAAQALAAIPSTGQWFPRFELLDGEELRFALRLRPRPATSASADLWVGAEPLARRAPRIKGPDLPAMNQLRMAARRAGADEAVLTSSDGQLLESSHSNVLWWRGDALCTVPAAAPVLPGVTRGLLLEMAVADGYEVREEWVSPGDLGGLEVWLVNALHGLRTVRRLVGDRSGTLIAAPVPTRAPAWRAKLDSGGSNAWRRE